jgi:CysZ protein
LILALSAPFMGPISEKIEVHLTGVKSIDQKSSFVKLLIRGLRIAIRNLVRELILTIPILLIGLIPIIGIFSTVLLFLMQAYFAGFGNMDYTLERHYDYKESVKFVKRNRGMATGNGIIFMLFLIIPVIGVILVLPFSVTAATTETVKRIQKG